MDGRRISRALAVPLAGLTVSLGLALPASVTAAHASGASATAVNGTAQPVDVVILADESGSMLDDSNEFTGMQQAATQIIDAEWSQQSRIAIDGFGSAPPGKQVSAAIDQYCPLTTVGVSGGRGTLIRCAAQIQARSAKKDNDNTDFAEALQQAYETLAGSRAEGHLPLIFFMSDGVLDEGSDSPYAQGVSDPSGKIGDRVAQALITAPSTGRLAELRSIGAEIWPIGFGQVDAKELSLFAAGGARSGCPAGSGANASLTLVSPSANAVQEVEDFQTALISAFADARCAVAQPPHSRLLPEGGHVSETVTISELATYASIIVDKGSPQVIVTFRDPAGRVFSDNGKPGGPQASVVGGTLIGAQEYGQQDQLALETLQLDNPAAGPWRVTFKDPPGVPAQQVGLSVIWQGVLGLQFTGQQVGDPGHPYTLAVQPVVRSARVPDSELGGFTGRFQVTWPDGQVQTVPARLDTAKGSPFSGDFTASVTVPQNPPNGRADVIFTGAASGVPGTTNTAFPVQLGGGLTITLQNTSGQRVAPGGTLQIPGVVDMNNQPTTKIVFVLGGLGNGVNATLTSPSGPISVDSGQPSVTLTIKFGTHARLGPATGTIRWAPVGQGNPAPSDYLSAASLDVTVGYPLPPLTSDWWFWLVVAAAGAVIVAALGRWLLIRYAKQVYLPQPAQAPPDPYLHEPGPRGNDPW